MKHVFGAIIREDEEDGGYWAEVPDLPGCYGQGSTFEKCVASISDGVETHVAAMLEDGLKIPGASRIVADDGDVVYVYAEAETVSLGEPSISASEAARRLGVTNGRVSQLIASGKIAARRTPRYTMVSLASLEAYIATGRKAGRPPKAVANDAALLEA